MKNTRQDPARDPRMAAAIRAVVGVEPRELSRDELSSLHARIMAASQPLLAELRGARPSWLDYAAGWSRTILPVGFATALIAASCLVWLSTGARQRPVVTVEHVAMLGAATNDVSSIGLADLAMSDVDMPAPRPERANSKGRRR